MSLFSHLTVIFSHLTVIFAFDRYFRKSLTQQGFQTPKKKKKKKKEKRFFMKNVLCPR